LSGLASDLLLPALPLVPAKMGVSVSAAQALVSVFFIGLAASQLFWGEAVSRYGPRAALMAGTLAVLATSVACALATRIDVLLTLRAIQGVFAGAALVVVPAAIKALLSERDAVRGVALVGMLEAIVPAAGPVAGAALLYFIDWRGTFWVLAACTLALLPALYRITPPVLASAGDGGLKEYRALLRDQRFILLTGAQTLCLSALLMFVVSGPQLLAAILGLPAGAFAALQVMAVAAFMLAVSRTGRLSDRLGPYRAISLGAWLQVAVTGAFAVAAVLGATPYWFLAIMWVLFCVGLAIRGPVTIATALSVPAQRLGRASAVLMFCLLCGAGLASQLISPFISHSFAPIALSMLALSLVSAGLVHLWGRRQAAARKPWPATPT
jgi:DHA1 family bicyclomycin/chloramphenicol resistance-like MFS transporter